MADQVMSSLEQVTVEWLTAVLTQSGALTSGMVAGFELDVGRGNWSDSGRIEVQYTPGSQGDRPKRLFLKLVNTDLDDEFFGPSEVTYYTQDYLDVPDVPLIRCYDAAYSEELQRYHLLLDDLSPTHVEAATKTPHLEFGLALAEGLAAMHAHWWGAERLAVAGAAMHSAAHIQHFVDIAAPGAGHILGQLADELAPHWPDLIHDLYARHPQALITRTQDVNGFTLIHGDVGCTNILVPRTGDRPLYIIDRQPFDWSLTTWLGVYDLAYAIVLDWDIEERRHLEGPVLQHYHRCLRQYGVTDYAWQQLWDDYRLSVAMGVYIATEYCRGRYNPRTQWIWLPMLQRSLTACDDLDCDALW